MNTIIQENISSVGLLAAFTAGFASFLAPCLLPMIPAYIAFLKSPEGEEKPSFFNGLKRALGFIAGFTLIFILLGLSASFIGHFLIKNKWLLSKIAGIFIIFFSLNMLGVIRLNFLSKDYRRFRGMSGFGMGIAFSLGWTPCFGPILGSIIASTSAISNNTTEGFFLLLAYSLGLAIPFFITFLFITFMEQKLTFLTKHSKKINIVFGVLMLVFGFLIFFDKLNDIARIFVDIV